MQAHVVNDIHVRLQTCALMHAAHLVFIKWLFVCNLFHADIGLILLKLYVNSLGSETLWYTEIETMKPIPGGSEGEGGRGGKAGRQVQGDVLPRWPLLSDMSQEIQLVTHQAFQLGHERCLQRRCTEKPRL